MSMIKFMFNCESDCLSPVGSKPGPISARRSPIDPPITKPLLVGRVQQTSVSPLACYLDFAENGETKGCIEEG